MASDLPVLTPDRVHPPGNLRGAKFMLPVLRNKPTMMRSTQTLFLLLTSLAASAQPVLEYANVDLLGKSYPVHVVTAAGSSNPTLDGANVTWDFSTATLLQNAGTCVFLDPASTPYAASFPTSNLAQRVSTIAGTEYTYFNLSSAQMDMLGEGFGGTDASTYTNPKTPLIFPFTYPNSYTDDYTEDGTDGSILRAVTGYGTVILPIGTYYDVVKVTSSSGSLSFYRSNPVELLVNIDSDGLALVLGDATTGVNEASAMPALSAVPNPVIDAVSVSGLQQPGKWRLLDAQGRVQLEGNHNAGTVRIALDGLAPGNYALALTDASGVRTVRVMKQ